ncbi:cytochrome P450 [Daldinia sp. FL1419]|nr:cytochrome P450 [Daldinia sp. FL1419]
MFGHDPHEPPPAPQSIPIIGHMIGLSQSKVSYYVNLSLSRAQKTYVVTKPEPILAVQKKHKTLAFPPIEAKFAPTVCGASLGAQSILNKNVDDGDEGDFGLSMESYAAMRAGLKPGPQLEDMNRIVIREITRSLDTLQPAEGKSRKIGLYSWIRDVATTATTRSVYGLTNPYDDNAIADAFWEFESGLMSILKVAKAFEAYSKAGEVGWNFNCYHGKHVTCGFLDSILVHSHPGLLGDIRKEIDAYTETVTENGSTVKTLNITALKESCPLLLSSCQEVLRYCSMETSILSRIIQQNVNLQGSDVTHFNPRRFLREEKQYRLRDVCFRAFGDDKNPCPGRHFATNEILAVVAAFIAGLDMKPVNGGWKLPTTANTNVAAVIMESNDDIEVKIRTRQGFEDIKWAIDLDK